MKQKRVRTSNSNRIYLSILIGGLLLGSVIGYLYKSYDVNKQLSLRDPFPERTEVEKLPEQKAQVVNGYALIPEMNIKLFVGQSLSDLMYAIERIQTEHRNPYRMEYSIIARFSTESLGCLAKEGAIGAIGKRQEKPTQNETVKVIGDYYYTWSHPQATCSDNPDTQALQGKQIKLFKEAFQTIEAIN